MKKAEKNLKQKFLQSAAQNAGMLMLAAAPFAMVQSGLDNASARSLSDQGDVKNKITVDAPQSVAASASFAANQNISYESALAEFQQIEQPKIVAAGLGGGPVDFGQPWFLLGLAALPVFYWLMRSTPPKAKHHDFPAVGLLFNLKSEDQEPSRMPWWQQAIGYAAVASFVLGMSQPQLEKDNVLSADETGPVVLLVDNDWASAPQWSARAEALYNLIDEADKQKRKVVLIGTAPGEGANPFAVTGPLEADVARRHVENIKPLPWPTQRMGALRAMEKAGINQADPSSIVWLSNGLAADSTGHFVKGLKDYGSLTVLKDAQTLQPHLLAVQESNDEELGIVVKRASGAGENTLYVSAVDDQGQQMARTEVKFKAGQTEAEAVFDLPSEIRNRLARLSIDGENSAGATILLDERWRRRPVGIIRDPAQQQSLQPLLDETNYIERAIDPYVELKDGGVKSLIERETAVLIMTDETVLSAKEKEALSEWVEQGGTLLRFAGENLAKNPDDNLLPVKIRPGEKTRVAASLTGAEPVSLAPFSQNSPFYGLPVDKSITVERQILAEPGPELDAYTWARLEDGSPLVTAKPKGEGWSVLVHTTAKPDWSNLPLSSLFIDMIQAVVSHSQGLKGSNSLPEASLPPVMVLNAHGQLVGPSAAAEDLTRDVILQNKIGPQTPPGIYGNESMKKAYNLADAIESLKGLEGVAANMNEKLYKTQTGKNEQSGKLFTAAFILSTLLPVLVLLGQRGHLPGTSGASRRRKKNTPKPSGNKPGMGL